MPALPASLGKRGGSTPKMTALRRAAAEREDNLREEAPEVIARAMRGETVDPPQLRAAQSIHSVRAEQPPQRDPGEDGGGLMRDDSKHLSLGGLLAWAMTANERTRAVAEAAIAQAQAAAGVPLARVSRSPVPLRLVVPGLDLITVVPAVEIESER